MTIAHQHLSQLTDEDQSGYLYHSVLTDARTKVIFSGLSPQDLQVLADMLLLRHYHPLRIKHIQRTPSYRPIESVREVSTRSASKSYNQSVTESSSEADSLSHSIQRSVSRGRSVSEGLAFTEGESDSYTFGRNSSTTESHTWGTSDTVSGAHTTGSAVSQGRSRGRSMSDGNSDSYATSTATGWSRGESSTDSRGRSSAAGRSHAESSHAATSTGEGQVMLPPEETIFFAPDDPEVLTISAHTGGTEGRTSSTGSNQMEGSTSGHADSRMRGTNSMVGSSAGHAASRMQSVSDVESNSISLSTADTAGWSHSTQEGFGLAQTHGESEAWSHATNRSTTRSTTATESASVTDGTSDSVGHTVTRGEACTQGESISHGESVARTPFYEYVREEIETPVFLSPEEQRLLEMQKLARPKKQHALLITSDGVDCAFRITDVPDPTITKRRLAAGLQTVYNSLPCYTTLAQQQHAHSIADHVVHGVRGANDHTRSGKSTGDDMAHDDHHHDHINHDNDDVIDVDAREVTDVDTPERAPALPSPAAVGEAALWERWKSMSHGDNALPSPTADDTDEEPVFWRPATQQNARQEKS